MTRYKFADIEDAKIALDNGFRFEGRLSSLAIKRVNTKRAEKAFEYLADLAYDCDYFTVGLLTRIWDEYYPYGGTIHIHTPGSQTYKDYVKNTKKLYSILQRFDDMQQRVLMTVAKMVMDAYNYEINYDMCIDYSLRPVREVDICYISRFRKGLPLKDNKYARKIIVDTLMVLKNLPIPELGNKPIITEINNGNSLERIRYFGKMVVSKEFATLMTCVDITWFYPNESLHRFPVI